MRFGCLVLASVLLVSSTSPAVADCGADNPAAVQAEGEGDKIRPVDLDGAIEKYRQAHQLAPRRLSILLKLASAYRKKESWDLVEQTIAKAVDLAPANAGYLLLRGQAAARRERWQEAKTSLERAIAIDPNLGAAHFELAEASLRLGDEQNALVHYTKAIELAPDELGSYAALADAYVRLGFDRAAERTVIAGEARAGDDAKKFPLYTLHGGLLSARGDVAGALTQYERAKKSCAPCLDSGQHIASFNVGASYAAQKPPRKVEAVLNLTAFIKMVCKGAAASRYADACTQAQQLVLKLGGTP